ncbi:uncharacterized protein LOC135813888 [Sycon ciliatum]|uniref:uncharacterized protein LOC135813888 n=1 Tax=Sycon ciliatum TaxID=27933 RepID=UPI0020AED2EB
MEESTDTCTEVPVSLRRAEQRRRRQWRQMCCDAFTEKGNFALIVVVLVCVTAVILRLALPEHPNEKWCRVGTVETIVCYVLSFGLFGFAGGFTNWLAIIMLFYRIPLLYGSGVIPNHHREIGQSVKQIILDYIFDSDFINKYIMDKLSEVATTSDVPEKINTLLASEEVDIVVDEQLAKLSNLPEGQLLGAVGIKPSALKPMVKPFVLGMGAEVAPLLLEHASRPGKVIKIDRFRDELDTYMSHRVAMMDERHTTELLERIIRPHLGWLIVWGTVFGSIVGVISQAANVAPEY